MQREIEDYLRSEGGEDRRADGRRRRTCACRCRAAMSFDRVERTVRRSIPTSRPSPPEQKAEIVPARRAAPRQNNTSTTYENTRSTERLRRGAGNDQASDGRGARRRPPRPARTAHAATARRARRTSWSRSRRWCAAPSAPTARAATSSPSSACRSRRPSTARPVDAPKTDIVRVMQTAQRPLLGVLGLVLTHRRRAHHPRPQGPRPCSPRRAAARARRRRRRWRRMTTRRRRGRSSGPR